MFKKYGNTIVECEPYDKKYGLKGLRFPEHKGSAGSITLESLSTISPNLLATAKKILPVDLERRRLRNKRKNEKRKHRLSGIK